MKTTDDNNEILKAKHLSDFLGFSVAELKQEGAYYTAREICQQPELWKDTWKLVESQRGTLQSFLEEAFACPSLSIILTGAGTSAYIGDVLQGPFQKNTKRRTVAIATTDLISHPAHYFNGGTNLLISFARSGDSPESVAALQLADIFSEKTYHLIITCNANGKLAQAKESANSRVKVFLLPPEANDQSLAMTGSFSAMLLSGLLISRIAEVQQLEKQVIRIAEYAGRVLTHYYDSLKKVAHLGFKRAVFLGSGPLRSVAHESDLKLQELTDGKVICKFDSFLGFRHGPKAVINAATLMVYLFSNDEYVFQYEKDLIKAIDAGERGLYSIGISEKQHAELNFDLPIILSEDGEKVDEEFLSVCAVLPAQILGFFKSLELGLKPDNPSEKATITRVVKGVIIYPYMLNGKKDKA